MINHLISVNYQMARSLECDNHKLNFDRPTYDFHIDIDAICFHAGDEIIVYIVFNSTMHLKSMYFTDQYFQYDS